MTAGIWNITAEQGATFDRTLTWKDSEENLVNLTGYTARMQVRASFDAASAVLSLTEASGLTLGGAAGTIRIQISAADMAALQVPDNPAQPSTRSSKAYVYDLELISGAGVVKRLVQGKFTVTREVTR